MFKTNVIGIDKIMKEKIEKTDAGIIIGRFHTHQLHEAHKDLIQSVLDRHERVIVFLGLSPLKNTIVNPLDFKSRKAMIEESFKNVEVHYIDDNRSDEVWSKNLDKQIQKWLNPLQTATLYGSRDCFIKHYNGTFPTCELESEIFVSATEIRKKIINNYPPTKDFRAGLIAATGTRFPVAFQTVDIAILNTTKNEILLVKKPTENKYRFCGGFSDTRSTSLEADAIREVMEETGVEVSYPQYVGSTIIKDWRYEYENDKIKTAFFVAEYIFGSPQGADDVESAKWFKLNTLKKEDIMEEHHVLLDMFIEKYLRKGIKPTSAQMP
jgi:bifunctional NMN adenylyltransferase/nudix hydrolase